ncbi:hypothetical protein [uncultured Algoriphagus sp.]|uniref:hypothetical protein n=1 Tax=uncultured Algoriphagus sp. TaxID=417365 RepID=UPI0030EC5CB0
MNYKSLLSLLFSLFFFSCTQSPEKQAQELVEKSIAAHQLSKNWENISSIKFKKMTRLLDESGTVESESEQWVEFRLKPYFEAKLTWTKDSILHVVNFNGSKTSYQMGENTIENEGFLKAKRAEIDAAYFAFAQPWTLLEENTNLSYEGRKTLKGGNSVESIRMSFMSGLDENWIYIDSVSANVVALEQHTAGKKRLIETISYDESTGLLLAKQQKNYMIDEEGKTQFLEAEYLYSDYQVTFE